MSDRPYKVTPVFDEVTLPKALRAAHNTKAGVWGVIRVLDGALHYFVAGKAEKGLLLTPDRPGLIEPEQVHRVEPYGSMRMQVEFYDHLPILHD